MGDVRAALWLLVVVAGLADVLCVIPLMLVAGWIAVGVTGVGATLVATDWDEVEALEVFGVSGWTLIVEAEDAVCALVAVAGGAISTVTLGPLTPVPALLAGVSS
ncbi:MAG: hypothetical protein LBD79_03845 [Treponema sp.]|nr:hypothetical protein [Treponema sp.]